MKYNKILLKVQNILQQKKKNTIYVHVKIFTI